MGIEDGNSDDPGPLFGEPEQEELFPEITPVSMGGKTITEAFEEFHYTNPHIYRELRDLALAARRSGAKKIGIGSLFERLRWDYLIRSRGDEFKLNNNFRSRYARLLMANEPDLEEIFELRELRSP